MNAESRIQTTAGRLARLGFSDGARAERLLDELGPEAVGDLDLLDALVGAADPDLALISLNRLAERDPSVLGAMRADPGLRARLIGVFGLSAALGDHVARHPDHWRHLEGDQAVKRLPEREVRAELLEAVGADPAEKEPYAVNGSTDTLSALRVAYRGRLLRLAARDVTGQSTFGEVTSELSDLASAALEAGLAIARADHPEGADVRLAVIGMGKCGARELNYISDVDVVFVAEPRQGVDETKALQAGMRLAQGMMRACSASTPEGSLWEVDAALRPEGKAGPLVRTLASHLTYYRRWAKTWEFQALLKARPVAGDLALGGEYAAAVNDLVWEAAARDHFVEDVQAMRRRVEAHVRAGEAARQIKLGPGGLRDIEFAVQLLQLVHGRSDGLLRRRATLPALAALSRGGYVARDDAKTLAEAYTFLRRVEHLLQLHRMRRTHVVPEDSAELRRIGRGLGMTADPVGEFTTRWKRHSMEARRLHEKLFYRPLLQAVARLPGEEIRLSTAAASARLAALGYTDPEGALRHIATLTSGVSRRAAIQRTLLPVMLGWFADAPDPDAGLLGFRQVSDKLGTTPWYLRLLRDETAVAERMARLLGTSRYATGLLLSAPEAVVMLGSDGELAARSKEALLAEAGVIVGRHAADAEAAVASVRALRRRELFRTAVGGLVGHVDIEEVGQALSELNDVTIQAALDAAIHKVSLERRSPMPTRFAVIAMGRLGGYESSYGSDADVMFVHSPLEGAEEKDATDAAHAVANELRRLLARPAADPPLVIDPDLRPEGRQGPLVRTLASYEAYYRRWSSPWESQALLRARFSAGDVELGAAFTALVEPLRYPLEGVGETAVREIRRLKARMEAERLPRGADPKLHTKLGRGGLSDVEWLAQLLQLKHAYAVPGLRTTRTLDALRAAVGAGLLASTDEEVLADAWRFASQIRDAIMLVRGRAGDSIPGDVRDRALIARALGYPPDGSEDFVDDYHRTTRRARVVVERVFYGG
ncbi:bifunctional [glutamine synthetase] adenylyltransferase/[glutamine synthetase]-adenylyl-L-tyrosine phosphorylase [Sphaerisporangium sp. TRM90804]|uniref:bifunctional [glutamine synthetase] adenylyltransferase/[glutamine synthetase]-adenylyl-L-tyrosine phosphorylase n=1 Tax=Sphaerisporangium sp. TRM90804 TaxID=3031113 RepID=UPI00244D3B11|nr:bifunctional [glutamine synthetase] adenylyltransferase/[glutamine synthetase]-adenylyl-L-tyrosine phosphorylase [Sphaerisporangium sp. TRM90804]MDH2424621.1 bifunctional [glutamine synthetase] adenylyltransferase/[glutamine synthetase]-adenylyl-L-tyrosine phosphorylase [Sphaerisporangium sp. TRM90804]